MMEKPVAGHQKFGGATLPDYKINQERLLKWIEALESGEYRQGKSWLRVETDLGDHYCCLGVACEVYRAENPGTKLDWNGRVGRGYAIGGVSQYWPKEIAEWFGFVVGLASGELSQGVDDPFIGIKVGQLFPIGWFRRTATSLNDSDNLTFEQIAASLREHFIDEVHQADQD